MSRKDIEIHQYNHINIQLQIDFEFQITNFEKQSMLQTLKQKYDFLGNNEKCPEDKNALMSSK